MQQATRIANNSNKFSSDDHNRERNIERFPKDGIAALPGAPKKKKKNKNNDCIITQTPSAIVLKTRAGGVCVRRLRLPAADCAERRVGRPRPRRPWHAPADALRRPLTTSYTCYSSQPVSQWLRLLEAKKQRAADARAGDRTARSLFRPSLATRRRRRRCAALDRARRWELAPGFVLEAKTKKNANYNYLIKMA
ncbi:Protein of unknown function [Gryllus bimaculatus]|nr:Protein of unknown function [Gryllus bimaculatus]